MAQERMAQPERFRLAKGRPSEASALDSAEGARVYLGLLRQSRQMQTTIAAVPL